MRERSRTNLMRKAAFRRVATNPPLADMLIMGRIQVAAEELSRSI